MSLEVNPWINSRSRRNVEIGVITLSAPAIGIIALLAAGSLKLNDGSEKLLHEVERAIVPDKTFTIKKLSAPHSQARSAQICRKAMIDEFPQFGAILAGDMSLFGPRGASPTHIAKSYEAAMKHDPSLCEDNIDIASRQKPGYISTYAIWSHSGNLAALEEQTRFPDGDSLDANAMLRLSMNRRDYINASLSYELGMLAQCVSMVRGNYTHYIETALSGLPSPYSETT